jgi:hypothetical protein
VLQLANELMGPHRVTNCRWILRRQNCRRRR